MECQCITSYPPPLPKKKTFHQAFLAVCHYQHLFLSGGRHWEQSDLPKKNNNNTKNQAGSEHGPPHYECSAPIMSSTITEGALIIYTVQRAVAPWGWVANMWSSRGRGNLCRDIITNNKWNDNLILQKTYEFNLWMALGKAAFIHVNAMCRYFILKIW